ncbi:hypothetical protein HNY73_005421 [Argiope bruennichi]|uniref:Uncharacterized protein n=1 Tax=Argiope bruennichi TaxID=94029 RepID=A0A8T0FGG8_ARGBR|nr:hypothetical protein HNY73_005421 [Argiope bruennichi]
MIDVTSRVAIGLEHNVEECSSDNPCITQQRIFPHHPKTGLEIGDPCSFSYNCLSGCCLKDKNGKTRCRRKSRKEERCSVGQIKLDMYMDYCPCEMGNKFCSDDPEPRCLG